jgi:Ca2+-binding RTX toxin-like protein
MTAGGLPIWGSQRGGRLMGNTEDNLIHAGQGNDAIFSLSGNDTVYGGRGSDSLVGGGGDDYFDGNDGLDSIILDDAMSTFSIMQAADGSIQVTKSGETITLMNVERLDFTNGVLGFDIDGNAGQAYRLYQAALGRAPDAAGLGYWIGDLDQGVGDLVWLAGNFLHSQEFIQRFGDPNLKNDLTLLDLFYDIAFNRAPDQSGLNYWMTQLNSGMSRERVLASFSESSENQQNLADATEAGIWFV